MYGTVRIKIANRLSKRGFRNRIKAAYVKTSGQEEPPEQQVVLLSLVLRKLKSIEDRLDRIEDAAAFWRPAANTGTTQPPANAEALRPLRRFVEFIKTEGKAADVLCQLHEWIDRAERVKALVYLKAAIEARVLSRPPFEVAAAEFPDRLGSKSLYYVYTGEPLAFTDENLETLAKAKEQLSRL